MTSCCISLVRRGVQKRLQSSSACVQMSALWKTASASRGEELIKKGTWYLVYCRHKPFYNLFGHLSVNKQKKQPPLHLISLISGCDVTSQLSSPGDESLPSGKPLPGAKMRGEPRWTSLTGLEIYNIACVTRVCLVNTQMEMRYRHHLCSLSRLSVCPQ